MLVPSLTTPPATANSRSGEIVGSALRAASATICSAWPTKNGSAIMSKTLHQAKINRIASRDEDDWNGRGRRHGRPGRGDPTPCRNDHCHLAANQICRQCWELIIVTQRPAKIDFHILPIEIAEFAQPALERTHVSGGIFWRSAAEITDHRHRRLLRARCERPRCRRAAEQRDESAPPHSRTSLARAMNTSDKETPSNAAVLRLTAM